MVEPASRSKMSNMAMNNLFLPPQNVEGDRMTGDKCADDAVCGFCAVAPRAERAGVLLVGVAGKPGPLLRDEVNWGVARTAGGDCSEEPIIGGTDGDSSSPGGSILDDTFDWMGLR